jgi:hypothetical protein
MKYQNVTDIDDKWKIPVLNSLRIHEDMWGSWGIPPSLTQAPDGGEWSASSPGRFPPEKKPRVPIVKEAGWASEPVWMLWNGKKISCPCRELNPGCPARSPSLYLLSYPGCNWYMNGILIYVAGRTEELSNTKISQSIRKLHESMQRIDCVSSALWFVVSFVSNWM